MAYLQNVNILQASWKEGDKIVNMYCENKDRDSSLCILQPEFLSFKNGSPHNNLAEHVFTQEV